MKKTAIAVMLTTCFAFCVPAPVCKAASSSLEVVLTDSLWGAGIGALAGAATLAFVDDAGDHTARIYQGAAIGLFLGMAFGVYELSPMFSSYTSPDGNREMIYGLSLRIPLNGAGGVRLSRPSPLSW